MTRTARVSRLAVARTMAACWWSLCVACTASTTASTTPSSQASLSSSSNFTLRGDAVEDGGTLPVEYTCDGDGVSPALTWAQAPAGTREYAVLMSTLPGDGSVKWNWILYAIPASTTSLPRNATGIGVFGTGSDGPAAAYQPPCSQGPGPKQYTFTVYALSGTPQIGGSRVTGPILTAALPPVTLASAALTVTYTRR
jgi:phosphatidylethanolamine-binding protein (PEBP) family uncharacterized protein